MRPATSTPPSASSSSPHTASHLPEQHPVINAPLPLPLHPPALHTHTRPLTSLSRTTTCSLKWVLTWLQCAHRDKVEDSKDADVCTQGQR